MAEAPAEPPDPRETPLYTVSEAARYLHVPVSTLRGWISGWVYGTRGGARRAQALIQPPLGAKPPKLLSFSNLAEAHVLASIRRVHRIPMHKIRKVIRL